MRNQMLNLSKKLRKMVELKQISEKEENFDFINNVDLSNQIIKKFILLTLSDKFIKKIEKTRKKFGIPKNGFSNRSEAKRWFECKNDNKLLSRETYKLFLQPEGSNRFKKILSLNEETQKKMTGFKNSCFDIFLEYKIFECFYNFPEFMFWGFRLIEISKKEIKTTEKNVIIERPKILEEIDINGKIISSGWANPEDNFYMIAFKKSIKKKDLILYIEKNWKVINKELKEYYGNTPVSKDFKRDFIIYNYHLKWYGPEKISKIIEVRYKYSVKTGAIEKIISRFKQRIKMAENLGH